MGEPIPFHVPSLVEGDIAAVVEVLESGWLTSGPRAGEFERRFAEYVGASHAVAVNSCTAALHLALAGQGVGPGDEVIIPTMTFASTAEVVVLLGATPVMVDIKPETLTLDPVLAEKAVTDRTRAIIPVHYGGQPADMDEFLQIADTAGVVLIEDAAHAFPASYRGRSVGAIGDITCFSFYATKTITTGEGGMITTQDAELADRMRSLSLHGLSNDAWERYKRGTAWDYAIVAAGYKYNLTDMAAALGLSQLERAAQLRDRRAEIANRYAGHFSQVPEIRPLAVEHEAGHAWHLYVIRVDTDRLTIDRNTFIEKITEAQIGTSVHYRPLHMHPYYQATYDQDHFPNATAAFDQIISLPIFVDMTDDMVDRVATTINTIATDHRR